MGVAHEIQAMVISDIISNLTATESCDIRPDLTFKRKFNENDFYEIATAIIDEYFPSMTIVEIHHGDYMILGFDSFMYLIRFSEDLVYNHFHRFIISKYFEIVSV
jgi:hypothetical protein